MSSDLLHAIDSWRVFESMPLPGQRTPLFVPFEELTTDRPERDLVQALVQTRRVALVGRIGCGKTSTIEYAVSRTEEPLAPLWISAGFEDRSTLTDPSEFARHVIRQITGWARTLGRMSPAEYGEALASTALKHGAATSSVSQNLGLTLAVPWFQPSWSKEVTRTLADPETEKSRSEFVASLSRLVDRIYRWDLKPVLIVDDFDVWLETAGKNDPEATSAFFDVTCRALAELNCALALSVQVEHCGLPAFQNAWRQGYFNERIDIPGLDSRALTRIFDERIRYAAEAADDWTRSEGGVRVLCPASCADVFEPGFERDLHARYRRDEGNLRPMLRIAEAALRTSLGAGDDVITIAAIRDAMLNS